MSKFSTGEYANGVVEYFKELWHRSASNPEVVQEAEKVMSYVANHAEESRRKGHFEEARSTDVVYNKLERIAGLR